MNKLIWIIIGALLLTACGGGGLTSDKVIQAFKDAGLEAENTSTLTKEDYGVAPYVCAGTRFLIPSIGVDKGGRVFQCDNDKDRDALVSYYTELGKVSAAFYSWVYVKDNIVVQINGDLPEETASQYETALSSAK